MERSEPADAWDEGNDGDAYPVAPIPVHERVWRHPSEIGQAAWAAAEPPVAIGRGLMVTTGAIGCVLGVAVLWLLTPVGGQLAPTASPIATSSVTTARFAGITATSSTPPASPSTVARNGSDAAPITLPSEDVPVNTIMVMTEEASEAASIAVAIGDTPFLVTTAVAVSGRDDVSLMEGGEYTDGVVTIDGDIAFIAPTESIDVIGFAEVASAQPGQNVLVLSDEITEIAYEPGISTDLDAGLIVEGTPVVDLEGALVALCTVVIDASGAHVDLLPLADVAGIGDISGIGDIGDGAAPTDGTGTGEPGTGTTGDGNSAVDPGELEAEGWLGVRFVVGDTERPLTIAAVAPRSPADLAGVVVGDRITSIDGVTVTTVDQVVQLITGKPPGTVVVLTIVSSAPAGATPVPGSAAPPTSVTGTTATSVPSATPTTGGASTTLPSPTTTVAGSTTATTVPTPSPNPVSPNPVSPNPVSSTPAPATLPTERTVSVTLGVYEPTL